MTSKSNLLTLLFAATLLVPVVAKAEEAKPLTTPEVEAPALDVSAASNPAPAPANADTKANDAAITAVVKDTLMGDASLKKADITVETSNGQVQLSGVVASSEDIAKATDLVKAIPGVVAVISDLRKK